MECMGELDGIRLPAFQEWDAVRGNICAELVSAGMNREQVDIQDRLSDHVYHYDRSRGKLEIAV